MTNKTTKTLVAFTTILLTAAHAFAGKPDVTLDFAAEAELSGSLVTLTKEDVTFKFTGSSDKVGAYIYGTDTWASYYYLTLTSSKSIAVVEYQIVVNANKTGDAAVSVGTLTRKDDGTLVWRANSSSITLNGGASTTNFRITCLRLWFNEEDYEPEYPWWERTNSLSDSYEYDVNLANDKTDYSKRDRVYAPVNVLPENGRGVPMVVVSHRKYEATLTEYLNWKTQQGYEVRELYTDEISGNLSGEALAKAIREKLRTMDPRPSYVLIVGSAEDVPTFFDQGVKYVHATDFYYGEYTDDYFADAYVGRFSALKTADVEAQIAKTMYMSKLKPSEGAWLKNSLVVDNATSGDPVFVPGVNYALNYPLNFSGNKVNKSSAGSNDQINGFINSGCSLVTYFGHGSQNSWDSKYFSSNIEALSNVNKYPVVASVTCLTGKYDSGYSFAETFARKANGGAVAVIACSQESYADNKFYCGYTVSPQATRIGLLRSMFPAVGDDPSQRSRSIGQAMHVGTFAMTGRGDSYYVKDFSLFNLFGDPTYQPYLTTPKANSVSLNSTTIEAGAEIVVKTAPNAMVALSQGREVLVAGVASLSGQVKLWVPADASGVCTLYSSAPAYHDASIPVSIAGTTGQNQETAQARIGLSSTDVFTLSALSGKVSDNWPSEQQTFVGKKASYAIFAANETQSSDFTLKRKFEPETPAASIYLRNKYDSCGIVTTVSGGKARLVSAEWAHPTGKTEVLGVYGSNTPYTQTTDAWKPGRQGTKIGELSNGGKSELIIREDYEYLLFRAENRKQSPNDQSEVYLKTLTVGWNDGTVEEELPPEEEEEEETPSGGDPIGGGEEETPGGNEGDTPEGGTTGGGSSTLTDYYLPETAADEWILTISENSEDETEWNSATFKKLDGTSALGSSLPPNAKVRIVVTDRNVPQSVWDYKTIVFPSGLRLAELSVVMAEGAIAPIQFGRVPKSVQCDRLNIANAVTYHQGVVKATELWIGYGSTFRTAGGYWECFDKLKGTGTVFFEQNAPTKGFDSVDHSKFLGYVQGALVQNPTVDPDPENTETGDTDDGSKGEVIDSKAEDAVKVDHSHGYDMTENYWDARKLAIQKKKLLFVLSGSDSCPYCHQTMEYLCEQGVKVDNKYVVYYARRQNGDVPMRGGLPQYGAYDPRTIDAFTGCYDENGKFDPTAAWYSGRDHAFASERGFSVPQINTVLAAATDKSVGDFVRFEIDVPNAILGDTPTKLRLFAIFSDGVKMEVDHGVEWLISEGRGNMTANGVLTAKAGQTLKISVRNAFYNFNAMENKFEQDVKIVSMADVKELRITSESFNIEDNPDVKLKAEVVLNDDTVTAATPEWTVSIKSYLPLPDNAPIYERKDGYITLDEKENGLLVYHREEKNHTYDGLDLQDHILAATATLGDKNVTKEITVYGPTRVWVTDWELVTPAKVAPGSVVRAKVNQMKYTYGGKVYETKDVNFAKFTTLYVKNSNRYAISGSTSVDIASSSETLFSDGEQIMIRVEAQKKGGKYSGNDFDTHDRTVSEHAVTYCHPNGAYVTSTNDIRVNTAWLKIYFPSRTDFSALVNEDADEDGFSNAEEFLLGTDPSKADDRWAFTPCHFDWPAEVYYRVMFMNHTFAGRLYTIEGATSETGPWNTLGTVNVRRETWIADENVPLADQCRIFRVKVQLDDTDYTMSSYTIPGYAVWKDITFSPQPGEKYAVFTVDSNDLAYPLTINFLKNQDLTKPVFSVPTKQVIEGTLERFEPTEALKSAGYRFERKEIGIWTEFYATTEPEVYEIKPGAGAEVSSASESAALKLGKIVIADEKARAAGQEKVLKLVAKEVSAGKWALSVEIAPEMMAEGHKIDDTVAALGKALSSLMLQPNTRAATTTLEIPEESVTPGLYYSLRYSSSTDFKTYSESPTALAKPGENLVLEVPSDNAPTMFFKVKASMLSTGE